MSSCIVVLAAHADDGGRSTLAWRALLGAKAYVLYQEIRLTAAGTSLAAAQVATLRARFGADRGGRRTEPTRRAAGAVRSSLFYTAMAGLIASRWVTRHERDVADWTSATGRVGQMPARLAGAVAPLSEGALPERSVMRLLVIGAAWRRGEFLMARPGPDVDLGPA